jgi:hypothetical protein
MSMAAWVRLGLVWSVGLVFALAVGVPAAKAAEAAAQPDTSVGGALRNLASRAGVIFVGRVMAIQPVGGVVEVQFAVEQVVQGSVGSSYTLREWAGLWPQGQARYTAGQHVLLFLNPANGAGLSTPVDGMEGVVPVLVQGASSPELADVRRLETRVQRAVGAPLSGADRGAISVSDAIATATGWREPMGAEPARVPVPAAYGVSTRAGWKGTLRVPVGGTKAAPTESTAAGMASPVMVGGGTLQRGLVKSTHTGLQPVPGRSQVVEEVVQ